MDLSMAIQNVRNAKDARFGVVDTESAVLLLEEYDRQRALILDYRRVLLEQKDVVIQNAARKVALSEILNKSKTMLSDVMDGGIIGVPAIREIVRLADKGANL
jgi:hypothetical protein